jgi:hypothetical protein
VKRIVSAYGGTVGVRSAKAGGAIFWFELPRAPDALGEGAPGAEAPAPVIRLDRPGAVRPVH